MGRDHRPALINQKGSKLKRMNAEEQRHFFSTPSEAKQKRGGNDQLQGRQRPDHQDEEMRQERHG